MSDVLLDPITAREWSYDGFVLYLVIGDQWVMAETTPIHDELKHGGRHARR